MLFTISVLNGAARHSEQASSTKYSTRGSKTYHLPSFLIHLCMSKTSRAGDLTFFFLLGEASTQCKLSYCRILFSNAGNFVNMTGYIVSLVPLQPVFIIFVLLHTPQGSVIHQFKWLAMIVIRVGCLWFENSPRLPWMYTFLSPVNLTVSVVN